MFKAQAYMMVGIVGVLAFFIITTVSQTLQTGVLYEISCADGESEYVTSEVVQDGNVYVYKNIFGVEVKAPVERCKLRKFMGN